MPWVLCKLGPEPAMCRDARLADGERNWMLSMTDSEVICGIHLKGRHLGPWSIKIVSIASHSDDLAGSYQ